MPKGQIADYVAAADVCTAVLKKLDVFKTVYPNKLFDYMSAARPIILGIDGVARQLLEEAGAGVYVEPQQPRAFAQAVRELKRDPQRCQQCGECGRRFVQTHYSREQLAEQYLAVLETKVRSRARMRAVPDGDYARGGLRRCTGSAG